MFKPTIFMAIISVSLVARAGPRASVLTGGPGSGKTALAIALELRGEVVVPEAAVDVIRFHLARGNRNPWMDPGFQMEVTSLQKQRQLRAATQVGRGRYFLDRSTIDGLAYELLKSGTLPPQLIDTVLGSKLQTLNQDVFWVEGCNSIETNEHRREILSDCVRIEDALKFVYGRLGFRLVSLPFTNLTDRSDAVLGSVNEGVPADLSFGQRVADSLGDPEWTRTLCQDWLAR